MAIFNTVYGGEWKWHPWSNTIAYYSFNDQWADGYVKNMYWNLPNLSDWTQPTYSLVSWSNYCGVSSWSSRPRKSITIDTSDYTVMYWFNVTDINQSQRFISSFSTTREYGFLYWDKHIKCWNGGSIVDGISSPVADRWYHWAMVFEWNTAKFYIDGNLITTYSTDHWNSWTFVLFGASWDSNNFIWKIDDCIIENKVWTADDITAYYNKTKSNYWL